MRDLLPLRIFLQKVGTQLKIDFSYPDIMHYIVFKGENCDLRLATSLKTTPRERHIAVKYHFFREHVV